MYGYIEQTAEGFEVHWDGELVAVEDDRETAERVLLGCYLFAEVVLGPSGKVN